MFFSIQRSLLIPYLILNSFLPSQNSFGTTGPLVKALNYNTENQFPNGILNFGSLCTGFRQNRRRNQRTSQTGSYSLTRPSAKFPSNWCGWKAGTAVHRTYHKIKAIYFVCNSIWIKINQASVNEDKFHTYLKCRIWFFDKKLNFSLDVLSVNLAFFEKIGLFLSILVLVTLVTKLSLSFL